MKNGVPESRKRRAEAEAREEAKRPTKDGRKRSPLADFLRAPTSAAERELIRAASNGELTALDIQAAMAAQIAAVRKLVPGQGARADRPTKDQEASLKRGEALRPTFQLLKQLVEGLKDVVIERGGGGGPVFVVELHWPEEFAGDDAGEDVRTRMPPGAKS